MMLSEVTFAAQFAQNLMGLCLILIGPSDSTHLRANSGFFELSFFSRLRI